MRRVATLILASTCAGVLAAAPPGREKSRPCAICHGPVGISTAPDAPHLAGQPRVYLVEQLRAFRDGRRRHEVMNVVARPLTDTDIAELAQWYASIGIDVRERTSER